MIGYRIKSEELRKAIRAHDPKWFAKVHQLLANLPANPTSKDFDSAWSDVKAVYIQLQGSKCVYCETMLEGNIANDVEHFRPKAKVSPWKVPAWLAKAGLAPTKPATAKGDRGYFRLAYEPLNYAASCKFCNSVLKKNLFPICGPRQTLGNDPRRMKSERPLLIYPIGGIDRDPETLIRFVGMHPEPAVARGRQGYHRALATIELFRLDDAVRRKELFRARALLVGHLYRELEVRRKSPPGPAWNDADEWVRLLTGSLSPHANCLRCFDRLYAADPVEARKHVDDAKAFLKTGSLASDSP
jgi:hypothetical protein